MQTPLRRIFWFVGFWLAGVLSLTIIASLIKLAL